MKEKILEHIKDQIRAFLDSEENSIALPGAFPNDVITFMESEEIDAIYNDDLETNGWQWDFWCTLNIGEEKFTLDGNGFYGGMRLSR